MEVKQKKLDIKLYILTPVLFLLGIGNYLVKNYFMFYVSMFICFISTILILFYQFIGKKFEIKAHNFAWNDCNYEKVEIDRYEVKLNEHMIFTLSDINKVISYKNLFFFVALKKSFKIFVIKTNDLEKEELIKLLQESNIEIEKKEKYFNIYKYFKEK